jgi:hypothetical protein
MVLKVGSKGDDVKKLQKKVNVVVTDVFDVITNKIIY